MVPVAYVTDRERDEAKGKVAYGIGRSDPPGLFMGWRKVRIKPDHRLGTVDSAVVLSADHEQTRSTRRTETGHALRLADAEIHEWVETNIAPAIRKARSQRSGGRPHVLVFIHGFNTNFEFAVRQTAQLAGDLNLVDCAGDAHGVSIAYSWPARGKLISYFADEESAEWTQQRLTPFLQSLGGVCRREGAELHLIAQSMGARALVRSLADLANTCDVQERQGEQLATHVILLAADISKGLFDQYVDRFLPLIRHLTIYVSANDRALGFSSFLHGGHGRVGLIESATLQLIGRGPGDYRRLGYRAGDQNSPKVDMIDVSNSFASNMGHSYEDPAFIRDLRALIHNNTPPGTGERSHLQSREIGAGIFHNVRSLRYWVLE